MSCPKPALFPAIFAAFLLLARRLFSVVALMLIGVAANAATLPSDAPLLSMRRVSFATGADHKWYNDGARGWQAGVFGAYNVTPHLSLVASSVYDLNAKGLEHKVGVRIRIFQGKAQ